MHTSSHRLLRPLPGHETHAGADRGERSTASGRGQAKVRAVSAAQWPEEQRRRPSHPHSHALTFNESARQRPLCALETLPGTKERSLRAGNWLLAPNSVPEPTTLALLGLGGLNLAAGGKRRPRA
ncbi:PEP-CTERM sorting domain-containing protein [Accumulibacter sp.]|uniref:PEP-CTERM sorting domain-containing protein n=1 Tax=Accumulibacter sp. TaxID=2053492 RepID=UPI0034334477